MFLSLLQLFQNLYRFSKVPSKLQMSKIQCVQPYQRVSYLFTKNYKKYRKMLKLRNSTVRTVRHTWRSRLCFCTVDRRWSAVVRDSSSCDLLTFDFSWRKNRNHVFRFISLVVFRFISLVLVFNFTGQYFFFFSFFLFWGGTCSLHMPALRHASQASPMCNPREGTSVVLRDTTRLTWWCV